MNLKTGALVSVVATLLADSAIAHPGHGVTDPQSPVHQIVEPVHAVGWLLLAAGILLLALTVRWFNPLRSSIASCIGLRRQHPADRAK
jgi:hypothetical protein